MSDRLAQSIHLPDGRRMMYAEYGAPDGAPVFYFHGEADRNVPVAVARKLAASIPDCRATFYPGEGHFSTATDHLDIVIEALLPKRTE